MWEFSVPPHKGDEHFDLGIWHPSALPIDKQNREGYHDLERWVNQDDWDSEIEERHPEEAVAAIQSFSDSVTALIDALPEEEICSRPWSIVFRCHALFRLISLWPTVGIELAPAIVESAQRHGLICYDPQNDMVTLPYS
jgi:hypothetical protein